MGAPRKAGLPLHKPWGAIKMKSSRRRFLQSTVAAPIVSGLAVTLSRAGAPLLGMVVPPQAGELFSNPDVIRYDAHCFTLFDKDTFLHSGSFHYSRCPRELWRDRLFKFKQAGFNTVETYIMWNYHEPEKGRLDLSELEEYIGLVKELGLWLIARPGPYACAEWDQGGFPHWVAAMRFPLRSDDPRSIETSKHWFDQVLPVIARHQITRNGPVIMMQLENEYDYWKGATDAGKRAYISALAQMAWDAGIEVPLFTCWTKQARENSDPVMARIMDTCNFYPHWKIQQEVPGRLRELRRQEPSSPVGVTELQGGWFSEFGGKLSVDQDGVSAAQLNVLTKTVLEDGATFFNYYMGFGGTNFDWAAKNISTTYDYAAPVREPGGLWEKYFAARGIAQFLRLYGNVLTRAEAVAGCTSSNPAVSVSERVSGQSGAVFVRENANAHQTFKMSFIDPASPTHRAVHVPREGVLSLGARQMKMIPVHVAVGGETLRYSTAEILAQGSNFDMDFAILYDDPGRAAEISVSTSQEPEVEGEALYQYWDQGFESVVFGVRVERKEKFLYVNNRLQIALVPRERALRSWTAEFPASIPGGTDEKGTMAVPFISDASLLTAYGHGNSKLWVELEFRLGDHDLTVLLPPLPTKCRVDGEERDFHYDRHWRAAQVQLTTPPVPGQAKDLTVEQFWVERFDPDAGRWESTALKSLDETGVVPYGHVKYRATFSSNGSEQELFIKSYGEDERKVFVNGKFVAALSGSKLESSGSVSRFLKTSGTNTIEISYEAFGAPNFGAKLGELKGIESVASGSGSSSSGPIQNWQLQRVSALMRGREIDPELAPGGWQTAAGAEIAGGVEQGPIPAFAWCRADFELEKPAEGWFAPLKLTFEAPHDALLYLNGKFVGRYVTEGPQKDFYLPEPYLAFGQKNVLVIALAYTESPGPIRTLRVGPYGEFATRRTRIEFEW
jgi:Glycosyl hydrolases family 35/Beta-galactosidase, domain 2/Beta-galactosidase second all-beta domain